MATGTREKRWQSLTFLMRAVLRRTTLPVHERQADPYQTLCSLQLGYPALFNSWSSTSGTFWLRLTSTARRLAQTAIRAVSNFENLEDTRRQQPRRSLTGLRWWKHSRILRTAVLLGHGLSCWISCKHTSAPA